MDGWLDGWVGELSELSELSESSELSELALDGRARASVAMISEEAKEH